MHIILEGPDNAGKTTLAKALIAACVDAGTSVSYCHPGGKPESDGAERQCIGMQIEWLSNQMPTIVDRVTPISQSIYNPSADDATLTWRVEGLHMMTRLATIVYCRPSTDRLLRTQDLTWRPGETEEHKQKIISRQHEFVEKYDQMMAGLDCIHYDFEDKPLAKHILEHIVLALGGREVSINTVKSLAKRRTW